jgi:hypothetical protein
VFYSRVIEDLAWTLRGFVCNMGTFRWMSLKFFIMSSGRYNEDETFHLFLMEPRVAYLAMLILPLHFNDIFLLSCLCIFEVCLWVKYDNVVLRCLPMFRLHCTFRLTLWRISRTFIWTFPCYKQSLLKSMLSLLWHANKTLIIKTILNVLK